MSKIEGKAKKYDGTAIDYVSIFNWADGKCIAQVVPDAAGNWEYEHYTDLNIGITYVADGCEPITHGAYQLVAEIVPDVYGYLFICRADISSAPSASLDITNTSHPDWDKNFKHASSASLLQYSYASSGVAESVLPSTTLNLFDVDWVLELRGLNFNSDANENFWTIEFLNGAGDVVAALKNQSAPERTSDLLYGPDLDSLTKTSGPTGAGSFGELSFTNSQMRFTNTSSSSNKSPFTFYADFASVVAVRMAGFARAERSSSGSSAYSGGYLKVIEPVIP